MFGITDTAVFYAEWLKKKRIVVSRIACSSGKKGHSVHGKSNYPMRASIYQMSKQTINGDVKPPKAVRSLLKTYQVFSNGA